MQFAIAASLKPSLWEELKAYWLRRGSACMQDDAECVLYVDRDDGEPAGLQGVCVLTRIAHVYVRMQSECVLYFDRERRR